MLMTQSCNSHVKVFVEALMCFEKMFFLAWDKLYMFSCWELIRSWVTVLRVQQIGLVAGNLVVIIECVGLISFGYLKSRGRVKWS